MTERERELLTETEYTRPVDFHSFRRQFKQALADAGVDVQQAMNLSGATDLSAHKRYLTNTSKAREIPINALPLFGAPRFSALCLPKVPMGQNEISVNSGADFET